VLFGMLFFQLSRAARDHQEAHPQRCAQGARPDYDIDTHFTPRYNPWDQRLCLVPNGDLFEAIKAVASRW
jgi:cation diffusion facilitator CzcD-associated flavoprotein CzcO